MGTTGGTNIGKVVLKVFFRNKSPFSAQPRQEQMHFFEEATFKQFFTSNIYPIEPNVHGYRIIEQLRNYDNFLEDPDETFLEEGFFPQKDEVDGEEEEEDQDQDQGSENPEATNENPEATN